MVTADVYISSIKYNICKSIAVVKVRTTDLIDLFKLKNLKSLISEVPIIRNVIHIEEHILHSLFLQTC
jgi:hypothetical protein